MKKTKIENLVVLFVLFFSMTLMTSCNRGYGCPNNFSISELVVDTVKALMPVFP